MQQEQRWLNISEAARHIRMSIGFVRKNVRLRTIPHTRVGAKSLRFNRDALDEWLASNGCGAEGNYRNNEGR